MESGASSEHRNMQPARPLAPCVRLLVAQPFHSVRHVAAQTRGGTRPRKACNNSMHRETCIRGSSGTPHLLSLCRIRISRSSVVNWGSEAAAVLWKVAFTSCVCCRVRGRGSAPPPTRRALRSTSRGVIPRTSKWPAESSSCSKKERGNQSAKVAFITSSAAATLARALPRAVELAVRRS